MMFYVFNDASVCVLETENENQAIDYAARIDGYYCTDDEPEDEVDYCAGGDCYCCGYGLLGECHLQCTR